MFHPKRILVPTDFSDSSDRTVEHAAAMAAAFKATVLVLHVVEENIKQCAIDYLVDYCLQDDFVTTFEREIMKVANERLDRQVSGLRDTYKADIGFKVAKGDPSDVILEEQLRFDADLVVIASHGRSGKGRHALGGVTEKVVRTARCPVMVDRS